MKKFKISLRVCIVTQIFTATLHALSFVVSPDPSSETEQQLFRLMDTYKFDMGSGFHRTMNELVNSFSISYSLFLLFGAVLNILILRKDQIDKFVIAIVTLNLVAYFLFFTSNLFFAFLPPVICSGLIFVFILLTYLFSKKALLTERSK